MILFRKRDGLKLRFSQQKKKKRSKSLSPGQFFGCSNPRSYNWVLYYFNFERNYDIIKSKSLCFLLNKNISLSKNEKKSKPENPAQTFREINVVVQLIYKSLVKSKIVMSWSLRKIKSAFSATLTLSIFIMCWIPSRIYIYTFTYIKILLHTLLLFVFKIV